MNIIKKNNLLLVPKSDNNLEFVAVNSKTSFAIINGSSLSFRSVEDGVAVTINHNFLDIEGDVKKYIFELYGGSATEIPEGEVYVSLNASIFYVADTYFVIPSSLISFEIVGTSLDVFVSDERKYLFSINWQRTPLNRELYDNAEAYAEALSELLKEVNTEVVDEEARAMATEAINKANEVENTTFHTVLPNLIAANDKIEELERKTSDIIKIDDWGTNIDINGETSAAYNDTTLGGVSMMFADILEGGSYAPKGFIGVNTDGVEIKGGNGKDVKVDTQSIGNPSKFLYNGNEVLTDKALKTINGETIVGTGDIVITGATPDLKHYSEGTAYAQMKVEDNHFTLGDENLFIARKSGDKESEISMKDEGIRLTTNGSVLINGKEAATLNDIKNQMNNLTVIEYPNFETSFYNYGWIRTVKRNQGVGFVGSDGVGLTLVTKEVMEGEDKVQTLKQYFIDNENNDIKVRTATLRTYADGATWFEKGAWTKLNDTYTQGKGITIDPTTKTISSNIDIADYYTKEQSDNKYALKGEGGSYDDTELRGRIETLESNEGTFQTDIDTLNSEVDTLSTQMENKAEKGDSYTKDESDAKYQEKGDYALKSEIPEHYDDTEIRKEISDIGEDYEYVEGQLANKADKSELFSGDYNDLTNKPTIPSTDDFATKEEVGAKQDVLVSAVNIKTINGQTLLGEGDIEVGGGASGNYLPLTGGVLTGRLQVGNASNNSITNAFLHQRYANNTWNGACFAINGDGTASFQHKLYSENFGSARNDAILRFSGAGLQFGVSASGNVGESDYKKVLLEPDLDPLKTRLTNIENQLNGLDVALETMINQF